MTSLIKETTQFRLTSDRLELCLRQITEKLQGRVKAAYVFGSASQGNFVEESDVDLILVVENPKLPFVQRAFEFQDLFDIYPKLDILVYTQSELDQQLQDSQQGFWKSVRTSLKQIL